LQQLVQAVTAIADRRHLGRVLGVAQRMFDAEGPGILAKLLRWRSELRREGSIVLPPSLIRLRARYLDKGDKILGFSEQWLIFAIGAIAPKPEVYQRYRSWCVEAGYKETIESRNEFYSRLTEHAIFRTNNCGEGRARLTPGREHNAQGVFTGMRLRPHEGFENLETLETGVQGNVVPFDTLKSDEP
jgi:phage/plasmid-associated DNA primase